MADKHSKQKENIIRKAIVNAAAKYIGVTETGGENRGSMISEFLKATNINKPAPWCASFMSYVMQRSVPGLFKPTALAKDIMRQYQRSDAFHYANTSYTPKPGDTIFFERGNQAWQGHAGFVEKVHRNGSLTIIEGNKPPLRHENNPNADSIPDMVRKVTLSPVELKSRGIIGFGDSFKMFERSGAPMPHSSLGHTNILSLDR